MLVLLELVGRDKMIEWCMNFCCYCLDIQENTKEAELIIVAERPSEGGLQIYEFEYKVDNTRWGITRIFSTTFVVSKKLYFLNISHSDIPKNPLDIKNNFRAIFCFWFFFFLEFWFDSQIIVNELCSSPYILLWHDI